MARDHYLPAAFLARFSSERTFPLRERRVSILRSEQAQAHRQRVENIGFIKNMYKQHDPHFLYPNAVDSTWQGYEKRLGEALDTLIDPCVQSVNAEIWLRVLVPFVAGLFVRGPDFTRRYESTSLVKSVKEEAGEQWSPDSVNAARLIAMRRGLAPVIAARWTILYRSEPQVIITNELGYVNSRDTIGSSSVGWAIPLTPNTILKLTPCPDGYGRKMLFCASDGEWRALIERGPMKPKTHIGLNRTVARYARDFMIGPTAQSVESYLTDFRHPSPPDTLTPQAATSHRMQIVHENEWDRLVCAIARDPDELRDQQFKIDWNVVASDWYTIPLSAMNLPEFNTGLRLRGRSIVLDMTEVPGFTDYKPGPFPWEKSSTSED
jgi:Protein of unknown function (DUF4238)